MLGFFDYIDIENIVIHVWNIVLVFLSYNITRYSMSKLAIYLMLIYNAINLLIGYHFPGYTMIGRNYDFPIAIYVYNFSAIVVMVYVLVVRKHKETNQEEVSSMQTEDENRGENV